MHDIPIATLVLLTFGLHDVTAQGLPAPTGPSGVGTTTYAWVDSARAEVVEFLRWDDGAGRLAPVPPTGSRTVVVQLWYPTSASARNGFAVARYNADLDAFPPTAVDSARAALYRGTTTHSLVDAPVGGSGGLPVLVFSPGGGTFRADYTALYEDLASHGYVVAAVSHPGITLMGLENGRVGTEWAGWRPPAGISRSLARDSLRESTAFFARTRDTYSVGDIRFVLDRLRALDGGAEDGRFAGRLDLERVGAFGHSTGGAVVAAAAHDDPRIRAVVVYDVILPRVLFGEDLDVPLMLFETDDVRYPPGWHALQTETFNGVRDVGYEVVLHGGGHNSFSDRALLAPTRYSYRLDPTRAVEIVRNYTRAFFDAQVRESPPGLLRDGASPPELTVTVHPSQGG